MTSSTPGDQTEREALTIDKNTGEWLSGGAITGRQGATIAASVLPGVTPEQVEAFYASMMDDRPTPHVVTTAKELRDLDPEKVPAVLFATGWVTDTRNAQTASLPTLAAFEDDFFPATVLIPAPVAIEGVSRG